jgi:hypothetical protein
MNSNTRLRIELENDSAAFSPRWKQKTSARLVLRKARRKITLRHNLHIQMAALCH